MHSGRGENQLVVVRHPGPTALDLDGAVSVLGWQGMRTGFRTVTAGHGRRDSGTNSRTKEAE